MNRSGRSVRLQNRQRAHVSNRECPALLLCGPALLDRLSSALGTNNLVRGLRQVNTGITNAGRDDPTGLSLDGSSGLILKSCTACLPDVAADEK